MESHFSGIGFGDGSGLFGLSTKTLRCGWSVVSSRFNSSGQIEHTAELYGAFGGMHQEVNRAEIYASLMYLTHAVPYEGKYTYYSDSSYLVDGWWLKPKSLVCSGWALHSDLWRKIYKVAEELGLESVEVFKVAAHRSIRTAVDMYDSLKILSNGRADELAKKGAGLHPCNQLLYDSITQLKYLAVVNAKCITRCMLKHIELLEQETLERVPIESKAKPDVGSFAADTHFFVACPMVLTDVFIVSLLRPWAGLHPSVVEAYQSLGTRSGLWLMFIFVLVVAHIAAVG